MPHRQRLNVQESVRDLVLLQTGLSQVGVTRLVDRSQSVIGRLWQRPGKRSKKGLGMEDHTVRRPDRTANSFCKQRESYSSHLLPLTGTFATQTGFTCKIKLALWSLPKSKTVNHTPNFDCRPQSKETGVCKRSWTLANPSLKYVIFKDEYINFLLILMMESVGCGDRRMSV